MIGFDVLRGRLLDEIRRRICNGEYTERALARRAGISQPHLHNLLKGIRALSPQLADQLMAKLGLTLWDLVEGDELRRALFLRLKNSEPSLEVPVLNGRLGPGLPWPSEISPFERVNVPFAALSRVPEPVVARLNDDMAMTPVLRAGDLVLLDCSAAGCASSDPDALFVIERRGEVAIRWVRRGERGLYLISAACRDQPRAWEPANETPPDSPVRARAIPLRSVYPREIIYDPFLPPRDTHRPPARQSGAS